MEQEIKEVAQTALPHVDQLASKLLEYLQSGMNIAQEQAPLFVNEIINWGIFSNLIICGLSLAWLSFHAYCAIHYFKVAKKEEEKNPEFDWGCYSVPNLVGLVISMPVLLFGFFDHLMPGFKALVAPRLYLIEYLSNLVK